MIHVGALMNYLTGTHAVSIFPRETLTERHSYSSRPLSSRKSVSSQKHILQALGFEIFNAGATIVPSMKSQRRYVGDAMTWKIPFSAACRYYKIFSNIEWTYWSYQ